MEDTLTTELRTIRLCDVVFDPGIYPRSKHDPALVQRYQEVLESIESQHNFMSVASDLRLIDGRHRHLAYLSAYAEQPEREIQVFVYPVAEDDEIYDLACDLNSEFGWQMTEDDKRRAAIKMYTRENRKPQEYIAGRLKVRKEKVNQWLQAILKQEKEDRENAMWSMWLACHTQEAIAEAVGITKQATNQFLQKSQEEFRGNDALLFRNFEPQVYNVWSFGKLTNQTTVFGSIPQEVIDNLLYYYTQPFDVVFDPFGGGGSTIDKCIERKRRYYVSDLSPIPARGDIRQWDIMDGLPDDLPVPDLVFLDPPYWQQAKGKYSDKDTDLGNVDLDTFLGTVAEITKAVKRKWGQDRDNARLAIIIGQWKHDGHYLDLPFLCYQTISKYLELDMRIQVPYPTQVHGGNYVKQAKENREILYLTRDLMVFRR